MNGVRHRRPTNCLRRIWPTFAPLFRKRLSMFWSARQHDVDLVTVSGGVSCNRVLRKQLDEACKRHGLEFKTAEPWLCTDNGAMIAFAAMLKLERGLSSNVTEEIDPNLALQ